MNIKGLNFVCTCSICPEQYEVFDCSGIVGYVRLRWGKLSCEYPDIGGETIYHVNIGDEWTGWFTTDDERMEHLQNIADKILEKLELIDYNTRMRNESDKHREFMEMKSMYEEGLLEG